MPDDDDDSDDDVPATTMATVTAATARKPVTGRNIYGNLHVAGIRVPAPEGGVGLWFLFTVRERFVAGIITERIKLTAQDLCMRIEGT